MIHNIDGLDLMLQMHDNTFHAVITDPPYEWNREKMKEYHAQMKRVASRCVITFSKPENQWDFGADHYCFWTKPISTKNTSRSYSRFVEMIFVYELEDYYWDSSRHWSNYVNVFTDRLVTERVHRCQKPVSLMERLIFNHTKPGDSIFDPFAGSGTTLLAAEKNGRVASGCEKSRKKFEIMEDRLQ